MDRELKLLKDTLSSESVPISGSMTSQFIKLDALYTVQELIRKGKDVTSLAETIAVASYDDTDQRVRKEAAEVLGMLDLGLKVINGKISNGTEIWINNLESMLTEEPKIPEVVLHILGAIKNYAKKYGDGNIFKNILLKVINEHPEDHPIRFNAGVIFKDLVSVDKITLSDSFDALIDSIKLHMQNHELRRFLVHSLFDYYSRHWISDKFLEKFKSFLNSLNFDDQFLIFSDVEEVNSKKITRILKATLFICLSDNANDVIKYLYHFSQNLHSKETLIEIKDLVLELRDQLIKEDPKKVHEFSKLFGKTIGLIEVRLNDMERPLPNGLGERKIIVPRNRETWKISQRRILRT